MIRVPLSKEERKRMKAQRRAGLSGKALLDDFQDDIADLVSGDALAGLDSRQLYSKHKTNQKFGADLTAQESQGLLRRSGDANIPERESLTTRRARMDSARAKQTIAYAMADADEPTGGEENEFYKATKRRIEEQKRKRQEGRAPDQLHPPLEDRTVHDGAREISQAIKKNRGLTPHRRKDLKNPRKKHRIKFADANVRRRGQVQSVKTGMAGAYSGEATGIKSRVSKSVKF